MPARAVPVDMTDEQMRVVLKPLTGLRQFASQPGDPYSLCVAEVAVDYNLKADGRTNVPILFPISGGAAGLDFRVNGSAVRTHLVWDVDILRAYEQPWRSTIDGLVRSDAGLQQVVDDARRVMAQARADLKTRRERPSQSPSGTRMPEPTLETGGLSSRVQGQLEARLSALGVKNASDIIWGMMHYVTDDWDDTYARNSMMPGSGPGLAERVRLLSERNIAVHLNPQSPDPIALWEAPLSNPVLGTPMVFVVAQLPLREGDNSFSVRYTQPVSFVNMQRAVTLPGAGGKASQVLPSGAQVCDFRFVLRTARFWRSFGTLAVQVSLPAGTRYAKCTLPGAQIALEGDAPAVTYAGSGLPDQNLSVRFAAFEAAEQGSALSASAAGRAAETSLEQAPPISLRSLWQAVVTEQGHAFARALPVMDANVVVAAAGTDGVICDRKTGKIITRFTCPGEVTGLKLHGDRIFVGFTKRPTQGYEHHDQAGIAVVDRANGSVVSQATIEGDDYRTYSTEPLPAGRRVVAGAEEGPVFALDTQTGKLAWQKPFQCGNCVLSPEAEAGHDSGLVFAAGRLPRPKGAYQHAATEPNLGVVAALKLSDGSSVWERPLGYDVRGLALSDGKLYVAAEEKRASGSFIACLRASDGTVLWRHDAEGRGGFIGPQQILPRGGKLVIVSNEGVHCYDPATETHWVTSIHLLNQHGTPPGITTDAIYVSGFQGLGKIDLHTYSGVWLYKTTGIEGPCTADGGQVFSLQSIGGLLSAWEEPVAGAAGHAPAGAASADGTPLPVYGQAPPDLVEAALRLSDHGWPEVSRTSVYAAVWRNGVGVGNWAVARPTDPLAAPPRPWRRIALISVAALVILLALAATAIFARARSRRRVTPPD
jgi:outer membrane protein assembly factor BamB